MPPGARNSLARSPTSGSVIAAQQRLAQVQGDKPRLQLLSALLFSFLLGGVLGALGFKHLGYVATVPLALSLMGLVVVPVFDDVKAYFYR